MESGICLGFFFVVLLFSFFNFSILFLLICAKSKHLIKLLAEKIIYSGFSVLSLQLRPVPMSKKFLISHLGKMQYFWCSQDPGILNKCEYFSALFGCQLCLFECATSASGVLSHCEYIIAVILFFRLPLCSMRRLNKTDK